MHIPKIGVIDYEMGNLHSVSKALLNAGADVKILTEPFELERVDCVVLPGVGNFGDAMQRLREKNFEEKIRSWILSKKPFLGICLGLQVLFEFSEESMETKGMGIYQGSVKRFPAEANGKKMIVPAMGWNSISAKKNGILSDLDEKRFYFVHSYYAEPHNQEVIAATSNYGIEYCSALEDDSILALQFHPEKSGRDGINLLKIFIERIGK